MTASLASATPLPGGTVLRRQLKRAERRRKLGAAMLVAPLFLFLLVFFVLPIGSMLIKSFDNSEMRQAMPQAAQAMRDWAGEGVPPEPVVAAVAQGMRASFKDRSLASFAKRLNYEDAGWRSFIFATARKLPEKPEGSWLATLVEIDPRWEDPGTWAAIKRASAELTDYYLLTAVDLKRDAQNAIVGVQADQAIYLDILGRTFWIAGMVTLACLLLAYPLAYKLATLPPRTANLLMILVLLPFWTSLLVRTGAWVVLLQREGLLNQALQWLGLTSEPLQLVYNRFGVYVAMIHILLPFMILPLYSVMRGIPPVYMRAAALLGARPSLAFVRVYLPLTMPGVGAGCMLVFIMALGYYITPALVGGASDQMLSYFVAFFTIQTVNWGMAASLGSLLLVSTLLLYWVYARLVGIDRMRLG
ncbi:ABC transporter permease [Geminicoccaceae bacterium 1502E]|nr:ABC transporter permease [Geminicoccaceae bacterium 1502E]